VILSLLKKILVLSVVVSVCVSAHGLDLKVAYQDSYPRYYYDDRGDIQGYAIEIIQLLENQLTDMRFVSTYKRFVPWKRIQVLLKGGELDVHIGIAKNTDREKMFRYVDTPLYKVDRKFVIRYDDDIQANNLDDIRELGANATILVHIGSNMERYLRSLGGLSIATGASSIETNMRRLVAKRGRLIYGPELDLVGVINRLNYIDKVKLLPLVVRSNHHYMAFSKNVSELVFLAVSKALAKLEKSGELKEIITKYSAINEGAR